MNRTILVTLIYIIGVLIGAFFFKVWGAETTFIKTILIFLNNFFLCD